MIIALLELLVVLGILTVQIQAFRRSRLDIARLAASFPPADQLHLRRIQDATTGQQVDTLESPTASPDFKAVLVDTNSYLLKNKGTASFDILQNIAERRAEVLDSEVQQGTSTPLYTGLMGTFLGAILGLGSLLLSGGRFDEAAIQSFLQGVAIAMIGSLLGLFFTQWAGALYRVAHRQAEERRNDYYTFLQVELLPILHSDMASSLGNLKSVLDSFNKDFVDKIYEFGPIIGALNENISTQKAFLEELQKVGYTQMADASIRVFDKVVESAHHFENFLVYQQKLNATLEVGNAVADRVPGLLARLTNLERGLNMVPELVGQHDEVVRSQLQFFQQNQTEMARITGKTQQFFDEQYHQLADTMRRRMAYFQKEADEAANLWQDHFQALNRDNIYEKIVNYMAPFKNLHHQQAQLNAQHDLLSQSINRTHDRLMQKMADDAAVNAQLLQQMSTLNTLLEKSIAGGPVSRFVKKVFTGSTPSKSKT